MISLKSFGFKWTWFLVFRGVQSLLTFLGGWSFHQLVLYHTLLIHFDDHTSSYNLTRGSIEYEVGNQCATFPFWSVRLWSLPVDSGQQMRRCGGTFWRPSKSTQWMLCNLAYCAGFQSTRIMTVISMIEQYWTIMNMSGCSTRLRSVHWFLVLLVWGPRRGQRVATASPSHSRTK